MNKISDRIKKVIEYKEISVRQFEQKIGASNGVISKVIGKNTDLSSNWVSKIIETYPDIDANWILTGNGDMLKEEQAVGKQDKSRNLIPLYGDVTTIGGVNSVTADMQAVSQPTEYIDTGDWFTDATAAIRHYGDSMSNYMPGCILALKEVHERQLIIWGKDYVIETNEYRITKRVQRGVDKEHIKAYSTNTETYPDGQLVHEPLDIAWIDIHRIFLILGYVVKNTGGTLVFSNLISK